MKTTERLKALAEKLRTPPNCVSTGIDPAELNRLADGAEELCELVEVMEEAAQVVVDTHNGILPIMNAYMRSLGIVGEWERTCDSSDKLREALARVAAFQKGGE